MFCHGFSRGFFETDILQITFLGFHKHPIDTYTASKLHHHFHIVQVLLNPETLIVFSFTSMQEILGRGRNGQLLDIGKEKRGCLCEQRAPKHLCNNVRLGLYLMVHLGLYSHTNCYLTDRHLDFRGLLS